MTYSPMARHGGARLQALHHRRLPGPRNTPCGPSARLRGGTLTGAARQNGDGAIPNERSDQQQLWVFDTADGSWAVGPPMLRARQE